MRTFYHAVRLPRTCLAFISRFLQAGTPRVGGYGLRLSVPNCKQDDFAAGLDDVDIKYLGLVLNLKEIGPFGVWMCWRATIQ